MSVRTALFCALLSTVSVLQAQATPLEVPHQGRLSDSAGAPVHGEHTLTFALWDAATDGNSVWTETHPTVAVDGGYYSVVLGRQDPLDNSVFTGEGRWLSVAVDGQMLAARTPVLAAPYAVRTDTTEAVARGDVACTREGQVRFHDGLLALCDGSEWHPVLVQGTLGTSSSAAAGSCKDILASDPTATSGVYWIAPGGTPFQAHCNMDINGGGWTLVATIADDANNYWTSGNWPDLQTDNAYGSLETALTNDFKSPAWGRLVGSEVLISKADASAWIRYDTILDRTMMSDGYQSGNVQTGEHAAAISSGSWWYQCSNLNLRLQAKDSDGNDMWSKGFIWRSTNNNGCSYDDLLGALGTTTSDTNVEAYWASGGFYNNNFGGGAGLVWVR